MGCIDEKKYRKITYFGVNVKKTTLKVTLTAKAMKSNFGYYFSWTLRKCSQILIETMYYVEFL